MPDIRNQMAYPSLVPQPDLGTNPWVVIDCPVVNSKVSPDAKTLYVPRPVLKEDMLVRQHELRHIRRWKTHGIAPFTGVPLRDMLRKMCDEIGLEITAYREGMNIYNARDHFDWAGWRFPTSRQEAAVEWLQIGGSIQFTQSGALKAYFQRVHALLEQRDQRILIDALKDLQRDDSFRNCEKWADTLNAHFAVPIRPETKPTDESEKAKKARKEAKEELEDDDEVDQGEVSTPEGAKDRDTNQEHRSWMPPDFGVGQPDLRPVDVHKHTASKYTPKSIMSQWNRSKHGSVLRYPQYFNPYGMVFGRRAGGGGMIIDVSSSMGWNHELLAKAIEKMPALWCAAYCNYTGGDNFSARLCLIAAGGKLGKYTEYEKGRGSTNAGSGCDLPALMYACVNSPKPLVWVSDGGTGRDFEAITKLQQRYKMARVSTMEDGIKFLMGQGVPGYWTLNSYYENISETVRAR